MVNYDENTYFGTFGVYVFKKICGPKSPTNLIKSELEAKFPIQMQVSLQIRLPRGFTLRNPCQLRKLPAIKIWVMGKRYATLGRSPH